MGWDFLVTATLVVLAPGTGVVYTVAVALTRGRRAGVAAAAGCTLGIAPAALAALLGVAAILYASAVAFQIVKLVGVAYLLWLAWMTLKDRGPLATEAAQTPKGLLAIARTGALINVLNPKLALFFMAFLPQFVAPEAAAAPQMVLLTAVFMALTFLVFCAYAALAAHAGAAALNRPAFLTWLRRGVAAAFAGFGLRLALAERI